MASKWTQRRDKFERRAYVASAPNEYFQADLVDLSRQNAGYILNVIDVFSRFAHSVKLSDKSQKEIERGLNEAFQKMGTPKYLQSDLEAGIYSDKTQTFLEGKNVTLYTVYNSYNGKNSAPIVERLNKTMKEYYINIMKEQHLNHQQTATKVALQFPNYYNNKKHSFLKMPPITALKNPEKTKAIQLGNYEKPREDVKIRFKLGDVVRLQKPKETIKDKFSEEFYPYHYEIVEVNETNPTTYKLKVLTSDRKDEIGLILDASYYYYQLKKI